MGIHRSYTYFYDEHISYSFFYLDRLFFFIAPSLQIKKNEELEPDVTFDKRGLLISVQFDGFATEIMGWLNLCSWCWYYE